MGSSASWRSIALIGLERLVQPGEGLLARIEDGWAASRWEKYP